MRRPEVRRSLTGEGGGESQFGAGGEEILVAARDNEVRGVDPLGRRAMHGVVPDRRCSATRSLTDPSAGTGRGVPGLVRSGGRTSPSATGRSSEVG